MYRHGRPKWGSNPRRDPDKVAREMNCSALCYSKHNHATRGSDAKRHNAGISYSRESRCKQRLLEITESSRNAEREGDPEEAMAIS